MIKKIKYYFFLAIKKPYLIFHFIYKKHLGVIISIPINGVNNQLNRTDISISLTKKVEEILDFYKKMNRDSINENQIRAWIDSKHDCFLVRHENNEEVIGAMWIFKNEFKLHNLSGRTLTNKKNVKLNKHSVYGAIVIVDKRYRGKGVNQYLLNHVVRFYSENSSYNNLIIITGASNGAYIRTTMKINGKLIGITQVKNILGKTYRKQIFLDEKEKTWE